MLIYAIIRWIINALLLMVVPYIVPGISIANFYTALITALVLSFVNVIIKPILIILTLPINFITLGLFTLVINGLLFWFVSSFIKGLTITGFWPAFFAALVYSIFSVIISMVFDRKSK